MAWRENGNMKNDFHVSRAPSLLCACDGIMREQRIEAYELNERFSSCYYYYYYFFIYLFFFGSRRRTPRHRGRFFMMYIARDDDDDCVRVWRARLKGLPDATSITPISLYGRRR